MGPGPDDLHKPLGQSEPAARVAGGVLDVRAWLIGGAALSACAAVAAVALYGDPNGGRPRAVARIETVKPPQVADATASIAQGAPAADRLAERPPAAQTAGEVERATGVKVTRAGGGDAPGAMIIQLDQPASGISLAPAPDRRLSERSRHGVLPRIGPDGARPVDVYARPVVLSQRVKRDAPRIALIVGGLGLSSATTTSALEKLPAEVSFAFAPYGEDVAGEARRARERGHETFLQAPMESFDAPRSDPGPHTLKTDSAPDQATADLHWLMTRFSGYVGLVNFLGAKFLANDSALTPMLRELSARGLAFIDDATAPQSLALDAAGRIGLPSARADIVIDADPRPEAIEAALVRLEAQARQKGVALGFANALPASIDRVSRFARALEQRGVALVPASAMLNAGPSVSARRPAAQ